jgi:hypothetical protein
VETIDQYVYLVEKTDKRALLAHLLSDAGRRIAILAREAQVNRTDSPGL